LEQGQHFFWRRISFCEMRPPIPSKKNRPREGVTKGGDYWGGKFRHARAEAKRFRPPKLGEQSKTIFNSF
jgi:hypothetical protein